MTSVLYPHNGGIAKRRRPHHPLATIKAAFAKPVIAGRELYVKFTRDARGELLLISFKGNEP